MDQRIGGKMPEFEIIPKIAKTKADILQVPFADSIAYSLANKHVADLSLMNSRMFRMNFGPGNTFFGPMSRNALTENELQNANCPGAAPKIFRHEGKIYFSQMMLQQMKLSTLQSHENFEESILGHLRIQLENTVLEKVEGSECPYLYASNGTYVLSKHKNLALNLSDTFAAGVWDLCNALWAEDKELKDADPTSYFAAMCRRSLMSKWLENTVTPKDLLTKTILNDMYLDHVIDLIMCHKLNEACDVASNHKDYNLSALLAQLGSGPLPKHFVEAQLIKWKEEPADTPAHINRLKLTMFLSGLPGMDSDYGPINLMEDLDWIQAFAIHVWYFSSPTMSVAECLGAYCESFEAEEFNSKPPTPPYFKEHSEKQHGPGIYDIRFHLLSLYAERSHPLEGLLNPSTHTPDPLDYRLSWLLLVTLKALGYTHCSEISEAHIHTSFAAQLETHGSWEWAIYVFLHIKDRNQREIAVQNILHRYVTITRNASLTEKETFLVEHLGVPAKWIDYAKAVKAESCSNPHLQVKYFLKAKQWNRAHQVIYHHIAPDAIINENLHYLKHLLGPIESLDLEQKVKVSKWSTEGLILLEFIEMIEKINELGNSDDADEIATHWEEMKPSVFELCSRLNLLPCPTTKHRFCQSEMAQHLSAFIRGVLIMCPDLDPLPIINFGLNELPLLPEFMQDQMTALSDMFMRKLSLNP